MAGETIPTSDLALLMEVEFYTSPAHRAWVIAEIATKRPEKPIPHRDA